MSKRENIVKKCFDLLKAQRSVRLGQVSRDPIRPEELAKTAFPAAYFETTDEVVETLGTGGLRQSTLSLNVVIFVNGQQRDKQRNTVVSAIEQTLMSDRKLDGLVQDIELTDIITVTVGEGAPYASCRLVFTIEYCYNLED